MIRDLLEVVKKYKTVFLLAILIRVLMMPFFFHPDLKTQNFHGSFLPLGVLNIYQFVADNKQTLPYKDTFNYPPLTYYFLGTWNLVASPFLGDSYRQWIMNWNTDWYTSWDIFKLLFILKIPNLFFDLLTGALLCLFLDPKFQKRALVLWFFNPISLYIIYAISNFDIVPTFLTILSVYFYKKTKFLSSGISLGVGVSLKIFPLLYLPFLVLPLLIHKKIKDAAWILVGVLSVVFLSDFLFLSYLPKVFNSGLTIRVLDLKIPTTPIPVFFVVYVAIIIYSLIKKSSWENICFFSLFLTLSIMGISKFQIQWLVWTIPLFILFAVKNSKLLVFFIPVFLGYIFTILNFDDRFLTLGILSPILPNIYDVGFLEQTIFSLVNKDLLFIIGRGLLLTGIVLILMELIRGKVQSSLIMSTKSLFLILNALNLILFLAILSLAIYYTSTKVLISSQIASSKVQDLYKDHDYTYNFKPDSDGLNLIYIQLKNPNFANIDPLFLSINDGNSVLTHVAISGRNLGDGDFVKFQISPLANIANKNLTIKLESPTADKTKFIQVVTDNNGIMSHKIYRKGNVFAESLKLGTNFLNRFTFDKSFLVFYVIVLVLLISTLLTQKVKILKND